MELLITLSFIFYFTEAFQLFSVGGYGFTYLDATTLLLIIVAMKRVFWDGEELKFSWNGALTAMVFIFVAVLFSGLHPILKGEIPLMYQFVKSTPHLFFTASFAVILIFFPQRPELWERIIKIWLILAIIINIFGVYQIFARAFDLPLAWIDYSNVSFATRGSLESMDDYRQLSIHFGDFYRATSIFSEPSALAGFNLFILTFMVVPYVQRRAQFFKSGMLNLVIFISTLIGTFLTFSMTAFVGIGMIALTIIIVEKYKPVKAFFKILAAGAILIIAADTIVVAYLGTSVLELFGRRVVGIINRDSIKAKHTPGESFEGRLDNVFQSFEIWEEYPITGIGLGNTFYNESTDIMFSNYTPLALLAETGFIGFMACNFMFLYLFIITYKYIKYPDKYQSLPPPQQRVNGLLFYIMLQLFLTNYISGNNLGQPWLWLPLGLIFSSIAVTEFKINDSKIYKIRLVKVPIKDIISLYLQNNQKRRSDTNV